MYLLNVKDNARYRRDVAFSDLFAIPDWFKEGHFALQTETVAFVAREILGLKVLWVLKQDYASTIATSRPTTPRLDQATANLEVEGSSYKKGLAMAREAEFLLDGSTAMFTSLHTGQIAVQWGDKSAVPDSVMSARLTGGTYHTGIDKPTVLPFNHWIIIDSAKLSSDKKTLKTSLWTWHTRRTIDFNVDVITNYLREAVFVKL